MRTGRGSAVTRTEFQPTVATSAPQAKRMLSHRFSMFPPKLEREPSGTAAGRTEAFHVVAEKPPGIRSRVPKHVVGHTKREDAVS